jgi:16S rRNA (adenine1518-N6/adenine1519-N6)-dimethyltransferase
LAGNAPKEKLMAAIDGLPPLRDVITRHGLDAKKALGQNFLLDLNLTQKIARTAGPLEGVTVIEVGPGPGGLTRAILSLGAKKVIAIERDARCLPALAEIADFYPGRLEVIEGDALKTISRPRAPKARSRSSPTCPTMSARSCWSTGSCRKHGRPSTSR